MWGADLVARLPLAAAAAAAHLQQEQRAQQQVAQVGQHVVEVRQRARRVRAQEVVVADVQRARHVQHLPPHHVSIPPRYRYVLSTL